MTLKCHPSIFPSSPRHDDRQDDVYRALSELLCILSYLSKSSVMSEEGLNNCFGHVRLKKVVLNSKHFHKSIYENAKIHLKKLFLF